jgi:hypothetical protein
VVTDFHIIRPNIRRIWLNHSATHSECKANSDSVHQRFDHFYMQPSVL